MLTYATASVDTEALPVIRRRFLNRQYVVTEIEPFQTLIRTGLRGRDPDDPREAPTVDFYVWTPYLVAITHDQHETMNLSVRPAPLSTDDEMLYAMPWPHVAKYGWVCYFPDVKEMKSLPREAWAGYQLNTYFTTLYSYFIAGLSSFPTQWSRRAKNALQQVREVMAHYEKLDRDGILNLAYTPVEPLTRRIEKLSNIPVRHLGALHIERNGVS